MTRDLDAILDVLEKAQALKDTHRSARTQGGAPESVAAHSWGLCLLVLLLEDQFEGVDVAQLLRLCILHDLGEVISGDVPAILQSETDDKAARERADLEQVLAPLPPSERARLLAVWDEYDAGETPEAQLARGLDKIETMTQHASAPQAPGFDLLWNLGYGRTRTDATPLLKALRDRVDDRTRAAHVRATASPTGQQ